MVGWRDGKKNGGGNSTGTTGALDALCVDTHICTHTHRLGTQISEQFSGQMIGSLMCILSLQDWLISRATLIPPHHPSISSLTLTTFFFLLLLWHSWHPLALISPRFLLPHPTLHPSFRICFSPWTCCGTITMTEAIRDIYHMCGGLNESEPSTGLLVGGTHTFPCPETCGNERLPRRCKCASSRLMSKDNQITLLHETP